ncbi:unnamed protein product, partial [Rangifer tarandus platyrhynchus]
VLRGAGLHLPWRSRAAGPVRSARVAAMMRATPGRWASVYAARTPGRQRRTARRVGAREAGFSPNRDIGSPSRDCL